MKVYEVKGINPEIDIHTEVWAQTLVVTEGLLIFYSGGDIVSTFPAHVVTVTFVRTTDK